MSARTGKAGTVAVNAPVSDATYRATELDPSAFTIAGIIIAYVVAWILPWQASLGLFIALLLLCLIHRLAGGR